MKELLNNLLNTKNKTKACFLTRKNFYKRKKTAVHRKTNKDHTRKKYEN